MSMASTRLAIKPRSTVRTRTKLSVKPSYDEQDDRHADLKREQHRVAPEAAAIACNRRRCGPQRRLNVAAGGSNAGKTATSRLVRIDTAAAKARTRPSSATS